MDVPVRVPGLARLLQRRLTGERGGVCDVDVQLTRQTSKPPIARQVLEITGATEPPLFVTDVRKALAQGRAEKPDNHKIGS